MTRNISGNQRSALAFLVFVAAVYLGNYAIVQWHLTAASTPIPEWPLAVDFFILLPLIYFILFRPTAKRALLFFIGFVSIGVLVGSFTIPAEDKLIWKQLEQGRWLYLIILVIAQLSIIAAAVSEIYRNRHAKNIETAIEQVLSKRVPQGQVLKLLQADARVWTYALLRSPTRFQVSPGAFFCAKHDLNASNQQAFLWLIAVEIPIAHVLIHLFSPMWAIVISTLSVYGFIFLLAEYRATLFRATTLEQKALHIRHGVLGDLIVPYQDICSVLPETGRPRRAKHALRFIGTGTANIKLHMKPGTRLETIMGTREVEAVYIGLDEPRRFMGELKGRLGA